MAVTYKKKKFMHQFAKERLGIKVPSLSYCYYQKYRGMEWLKFIDEECNHCCLLFNGGYGRITVSFIDDDGVPHLVRNEIVKDI